MVSVEQIDLLMSEVGPVLDPLVLEAYAEDGRWAVALDEHTAVLVDFDERKGSLVLSTELGEPSPGDRTALYEKLLQLNFHWDITGGNRMAVDGPGGKVVQIFETPAEGLDATRLSALLVGFADAARAWRQIVQRPASAWSSPLEPGAGLGILV